MAFGYDPSKDHTHFTAGTLTTAKEEHITITVSSYEGNDPSKKVALVRRYKDFRGNERVDGKTGRLSAKDAHALADLIHKAANWIETDKEDEDEEPAPVKKPAKTSAPVKVAAKPEKKILPKRGSQWAKKPSKKEEDES